MESIFYYVHFLKMERIEVIGKSKQNTGYWAAIRQDSKLWGIHYTNISMKGYPYCTEGQIERAIGNLTPTVLLKRLDDPDYLKDSRSAFLNAVKMCYNLTPIERRLWRMYEQKNSQ